MDTISKQMLGLSIHRIALGIVLIAHSAYLKIFIFTMPGTTAYFSSIGLPEWLAYAVLIIETAVGLLLIVGYQVKLASLAIIPVLLGATWAHFGSGWLFSNEGGGWEYPLFLTIAALVQFLVSD